MCIICVLWFILHNSVLVLFAVVLLDLVSLVPCQEIGWEERLWNDLFCVQWNVKPSNFISQSRWTWLTQLHNSFFTHLFLNSSIVVSDMFLWTFLSPASSVKTLMETQSSDLIQWPGLILSSSTTGVLMEKALLPLRCLSGASTRFDVKMNWVRYISD